MQEVAQSEVDADIERLATGIRQLKIQYDMFFSGALPRQPLELRAEIERLIKRHSISPIRKYAVRFHFNSLVSRFNSLSELWAKTLRATEEGERPPPAVSDRQPPPEQILATCRLHDPGHEQEVLRLMHARFLEARRKAGEEKRPPSFEAFLHGIASQAARLREKSGCDQIELRLVVRDRKVHLKARPGR